MGLVLQWQMIMCLYIFNLNLKYHFNHLFGFTAQPTTTGWCWIIKLPSYMYKLLGEHEASFWRSERFPPEGKRNLWKKIRNSPDNKGEENILSRYIDSEHENKKNVKIFPSTYHARPIIQTFLPANYLPLSSYLN